LLSRTPYTEGRNCFIIFLPMFYKLSPLWGKLGCLVGNNRVVSQQCKLSVIFLYNSKLNLICLFHINIFSVVWRNWIRLKLISSSYLPIDRMYFPAIRALYNYGPLCKETSRFVNLRGKQPSEGWQIWMFPYTEGRNCFIIL
jgi:hypothetical protein